MFLAQTIPLPGPDYYVRLNIKLFQIWNNKQNLVDNRSTEQEWGE
jgi:hypothetical protein